MQIHRIIKLISVLIVLTIILINTTKVAGADEMADEKTVPLPSIELRSIVSQWMTDKEFNIISSVQQYNRWAFTAIKDDISIHVTIRPYSPLASVISIQYSKNSRSAKIESNRLLEYIRKYSDDVENVHDQTKSAFPSSVNKHIKSVACIIGRSNGKPIQFTGFVLDNKRLILSTAHDLEMVRNMTVLLHNGKEVSGTVIKTDFEKDLSLIQVTDSVNSSISLKQSRTLIDNRERVFTIGCPNNSRAEIQSGLIDGSLRKIKSSYLWQAQIKTLPGSSGSPAFDEYGNLIGIVKGSYRGSESIGFIITMNTIIDFLQGL